MAFLCQVITLTGRSPHDFSWDQGERQDKVSGADGPGVKEREVTDEKYLAIGSFYFEIVYCWPVGIHIPLVPAVDDFLNLPAAPLVTESNGTFVGLVAAVAFNLYSFVVC